MENPIAGTVPFEIDGTTYTMRLTWHGVAQVRRAYPDGYNLADPEHLAVIMSIAMNAKHPEMTADRIMDLSPPLETAIEAVSTLINYSWWGQKTPPERKEEGEPEKNPRKTKATPAAA
jgi:hypothetical protein